MLTNHLDDKVSNDWDIGESQADILLFSWTKQHWWYQYHEKYQHLLVYIHKYTEDYLQGMEGGDPTASFMVVHSRLDHIIAQDISSVNIGTGWVQNY